MPIIRMTNDKRKRVNIEPIAATKTEEIVSNKRKRENDNIIASSSPIEVDIIDISDDDETNIETTGREEAIKNEIERQLKETECKAEIDKNPKEVFKLNSNDEIEKLLQESAKEGMEIQNKNNPNITSDITLDFRVVEKVVKYELKKYVVDVQKLTRQKFQHYEKQMARQASIINKTNEKLAEAEKKLKENEKKHEESIAEITKKLSDAEEVLGETTKRLFEANENYNLTSKKIEETELLLKNSEKNLEEIKKKFEDTNDHLNVAKGDLEEFETKLNDANKKQRGTQSILNHNIEKLKECHTKLDEMEGELEKSREKLVETESKLIESNSKLSKVEIDLAGKDTELAETEKQYKIKLANKENLLKNLMNQSEEHKQYLEKQFQSNQKDLESNFRAKNEALSTKIDGFEKLMIRKDELIKSKDETLKKLEDEKHKLSLENQSLRESEEDFSFKMNTKVKASLDQLQIEHDELKKDRNEKKKEIDELIDEKKSLELKCKDLIQDKRNLKLDLAEAERINKENEKLDKDLGKSKNKCEKQMKELKSTKDQLEKLKNQESELKLLKEQNVKLEKKKSQYKKSERKLEKDKMDLLREIAELRTIHKQDPMKHPMQYKIPKKKTKEQNVDDSKYDVQSKKKVIEDKKNTPTLKYHVSVSNIDLSVTKRDMEALFQRFGKKNGVLINLPQPAANIDSEDLDVQNNKGFGWVVFFNKDDAARAITEINARNFHGKKLVVRWAQ